MGGFYWHSFKFFNSLLSHFKATDEPTKGILYFRCNIFDFQRVLFFLFQSLCIYSHLFSMLSASSVSAIKKKHWKKKKKKHWRRNKMRYLEVKPTKVWVLITTGSRSFTLKRFIHWASSNSSKLPFKCSYHLMPPVVSALR